MYQAAEVFLQLTGRAGKNQVDPVVSRPPGLLVAIQIVAKVARAQRGRGRQGGRVVGLLLS